MPRIFSIQGSDGKIYDIQEGDTTQPVVQQPQRTQPQMGVSDYLQQGAYKVQQFTGAPLGTAMKVGGVASDIYGALKKPIVDMSMNIPGSGPNIISKIPEMNVESPIKQLTSKILPESLNNTIFPKVQITGPKAARGMADIGVDIGSFSLARPMIDGVAKAGKSVGNLFNYGKRATEEIGSKITPQAIEAINSRVRGMNPEALNAIGVPDKSIKIAQNVGEKAGLQELPSKSMADEYYKIASDSIPKNAEIPTTNLERVISEPSNQSQATTRIKQLLDRTRLNENGVLEKVPLSKEEYQSIRNMLNNIDPTGENPSIQITKHALDSDVGVLSPEVAKANATFQVSRELGKAQKYIDNPKLKMNIQDLLEKSQKSGEVSAREHLRSLIGDKADSIIKQLEKNQSRKNIASVTKTLTTAGIGIGLVDYLIHKIIGRSISNAGSYNR